MKLAIGIAAGLFLLLVLVRNKRILYTAAEKLSVFWFRLAAAFLVLFLLNVGLGLLGFFVPVNLMSGLMIAILGVPGVASVCALSVLL
ncbi:pro-sigmaK processing inhibitor BofA family protein [Bhargavaea beijingensis]|uniref:Inhibitor of the pro-sigma K processing machinery n=1 Tax=Bhargavaea beijingensis TaxID=426756 RepID=A0A1G7GRZ5_9BACL|nr:pro-sigmaK processing inhibitor BofA family protein [Bhargavaea beijingensis]MCW1929628.1 pro-sigmaK processing inhibitor BofA family protein [Bhargavaea beijingensis]RSK31636.1 pro-sigmaK processing inhibitor BofA [Bhargavaea beijingensis]SDE90922.1 inhibitor of the pro-sigma K processing machinery [Bhargavaea beijingensis]